jgi:hypothetical protein
MMNLGHKRPHGGHTPATQTMNPEPDEDLKLDILTIL